jgi:succinate dehydrogenase/fumarate reductase flavoprotein subunit
MRAAEHIARKKNQQATEDITGMKDQQAAEYIAKKQIQAAAGANRLAAPLNIAPLNFEPPKVKQGEISNWRAKQEEIQKRMSRSAAYTRSPEEMGGLHNELCRLKDNFFDEMIIVSEAELPLLYKFYDSLLTQIAVLSAMLFAAEQIGSRGGALVKDADKPQAGACFNDRVIVTGQGKSYFEPVRPMPACDDWFETVWNEQQY